MTNNGNNLRGFDKFEIDLEKKILWVDNSPADLPVKAVEMLCFLIECEGNVVSKDDLLNKLWSDSIVEEGVLPQNVYLLRKFFKKHGSERNLIETVARRGYRFTGDLTEDSDEVQITIERQTIERTFVAEAEFSDEGDEIVQISQNEVSEPRGKIFALRNAAFIVIGTVAIFVLGVFGAAWIYPNYFQGDSADTSSSSIKYERLTESGRAYYVGLSPDMQNAAYVIHTADNKYSLILHHLATRSETVIVEPQPAHLSRIIFSPDGNYIYYAAQHGKKQNTVYRMPIYGGASQAIAENFAHHFSISPDGEWLSFYRWEQGVAVHLEICRSRDGSERRIVASKSDKSTFKIWGLAPEWSPDGKKLVSVSIDKPGGNAPDTDQLVEINVANGTETRIKTPDWYRLGQAIWETDGKGLFVMVREKLGKPVQIWHIGYPTGIARNITNDENDYREFRIAADSSFIVAATWSHTGNLYLVSAEDPANVRQLTFDSNMQNGGSGLKWTVDGKSIVYGRTEGYSVGNLAVFDLEKMESRQLTQIDDSMQSYIDVTPDGKSAVFGSNRNGRWNIWQIDLDGENLRQLTDGRDDGAPEISPDGQWLYYVSDGLWKKSLGGGEPLRVMKNMPGTTRVSPTNPRQLVSYYSDLDEKTANKWKFIIYLEDDPGNFADLEIPAIIQFDWKPDGSGIYYADNGESFNNLWFVSKDDRKKTQITKFGDQRISNLSLSPDGKTFVIARGSATGSIFKLTNF